MAKPTMPVTGFWMRNNITSDDLGNVIEFLVEHNGEWIVVFPTSHGPTPRDPEQMIDHMIWPLGVQNLIDHGTVHSPSKPVRARKTGRADRRTNTDRRAAKRRLDDKSKALVAGRRKRK